MILTDTHTHLYSSQFDEDRKQVIEKCLENGISNLFLPGIDSSSIEGMLALEKAFPNNCHAMMGLHPCSVKDNYKEELTIVLDWLNQRDFCAIGEIGIDLYWDKSTLKHQQDAFKTQIEWAKERALPFVIHCRDAFDEIFEIMDELNDDNMKGIFHCFTGNIDQAHHIINYSGFKLGIGGVVTFKNSGLDRVVHQIGLEHLVLETDSPYLAPTPYRGKRNESAYLVNIAQKVAEIHQTSLEKIAEITTQNAKDVFGF